MSPNVGKELRAIREEAERKGWRVWKTPRGKHWNMYCPCPRKCKKRMSNSPSGANYVTNLLGQLDRGTCWKDGEDA